MSKAGRVYLIGAGPGDPELLTLKAARMLSAAEVVVHDRLVSPEVLALAPADAQFFPVGKMPGCHPCPQEEINALLVRLAGQGLLVARLKGGDPFIFGRGWEEAEELIEAGIAFEIAPGITAAQGASASLGLPLTHRGLASGVRYVTGHFRQGLPLDCDWQGLADPDTTLVVYMGAATIHLITERLIAEGLAGDTPVVAVSNATTPRERRVAATLADISAVVGQARLSGPVLFIIGRVAGLYEAAPKALLSRLVAAARRNEATHA